MAEHGSAGPLPSFAKQRDLHYPGTRWRCGGNDEALFGDASLDLSASPLSWLSPVRYEGGRILMDLPRWIVDFKRGMALAAQNMASLTGILSAGKSASISILFRPSTVLKNDASVDNCHLRRYCSQSGVCF